MVKSSFNLTLSWNWCNFGKDNIFLDLQDYTYYFVPAPWLSCKLLRLLQLFPPPSEQARLIDCLDTILNKVQEAPKSKKIQHSNAKNAVLLEAINLIIHLDSDAGKMDLN